MKYLIILFISLSLFAQEKRVKIAVIDSGVGYWQAGQKFMCQDGRKTLIKDDNGYDTNGHGRNIISIITRNLNPTKYCIISYKVIDFRANRGNMKHFVRAIYQAIRDKVKYINISMSGYSKYKPEYLAIIKALKRKITIIVAAGNDGWNLDQSCTVFPACYKKYIKKRYRHRLKVIGANLPNSNYSKNRKIINIYENGKNQGSPVMSGTSQATANYTGKIISRKNKKYGTIIYRRQGCK